jgi:hypothetical protein
MVNAMRYSGMGGLGRWIPALNANAANLAHLDGARLRLAKIATDVEGIAHQQTAFAAEFGLQPSRSRQPRAHRSGSDPALPTAHLAAVANSKQ